MTVSNVVRKVSRHRAPVTADEAVFVVLDPCQDFPIGRASLRSVIVADTDDFDRRFSSN